MSIYEQLGVRPIINANATLTRLGGSRMPAEVMDAMVEASRCFVDLDELQSKVGARIAELTHNEAAYVSSGAAAGLALATAACVTARHPELHSRLPVLGNLGDEVIIHTSHRNGYDYAVRQVGVNIVQIGDDKRTIREELEQAISFRTAAIFWFQGAMTGPASLPLQQVIDIARRHRVPVIVDAAAQLPPVTNLWNYTKMGAALAVFSGGKELRGPQSSGLIVGRKDLIEGCARNGNPNHSIGRPMKVGKEEMVGLLTAVERYLALDHEARAAWCEQVVADWNVALSGLPGVTARRDYPNEAGQPIGRSLITLAPPIDRDAVASRLAESTPGISVAVSGANSIFLNPMTLDPGEEQVVLERLVAAIHSAA